MSKPRHQQVINNDAAVERARLTTLRVPQLNTLLRAQGLMTPKRRRLRKGDKVSLLIAHNKRPTAKRNNRSSSAVLQLCPKVMQKNQRLRVIIASLVTRLSAQRKTCVRNQENSLQSVSLQKNTRLLKLLRQSQELATESDQKIDASLPSGRQCQGMIDMLEEIIAVERTVWNGGTNDKVDLVWKLRVLETHRRVVHSLIRRHWRDGMDVEITAHRILLDSDHFRWFGYVEGVRSRPKNNTWWDCLRDTANFSEQERAQLHETVHLLRQLQYSRLYTDDKGVEGDKGSKDDKRSKGDRESKEEKKRKSTHPLVLESWSSSRPTRKITRMLQNEVRGTTYKLIPFHLLLFATKMSDKGILKSINKFIRKRALPKYIQSKVNEVNKKRSRTEMTEWLLVSLHLYQTQHQYHDSMIQKASKESIGSLEKRFLEAKLSVREKFEKLFFDGIHVAEWAYSLANLFPIISSITGYVKWRY